MSDGSLMNLGDLAKPIDTLIKKISKGTGILYEPRRIRNVAKAESDAAKIKTESEIEIADLRHRAEQRRLEEEMRHQKNIEDIIDKAEPHLNENANPENMEDDWIANFFDKCRIVSDSDMQSLWARVLAGEAHVPGTYSKRTVNFISELDKNEADLFTKLCGFGWKIGIVIPLVFDQRTQIYTSNGINFDALSHLDSIGLVQFQSAGNFVLHLSPKDVLKVHYYGRPLHIEMPKDSKADLNIGKISLTRIGEELALICGSKPVDGFYEYAKEQWKQYLPVDNKV